MVLEMPGHFADTDCKIFAALIRGPSSYSPAKGTTRPDTTAAFLFYKVRIEMSTKYALIFL
jgi:hypothetical protein